MNKSVDPEDFKNAVEQVWQLARIVESIASKDDVVDRHFSTGSQKFVQDMMLKYPLIMK